MSSSTYSLRCPKLCGINVKVHVTFFVFLLIAFLVSLRFVREFPLFCVLVGLLYGPILLVSVLIHEWAHLWMFRRMIPCNNSGVSSEVVLWPLGGYVFCDGLTSTTSSTQENSTTERGTLAIDIKIALAGPFVHIPMGLFWVAMYASINNGDMSAFTFRMYLSVLSNDFRGFFSTLFEQSCLLNILLLWFNVFLPMYPLDGGRVMTSAMLMIGMALNKTALVTCFVSLLESVALLAWSIASFVDGVGTTGIVSFLIAIFVIMNSYKLYSMILNGQLREHPLFGRDCYINREVRHSIFQLSSAARNASTLNTTTGETENDHVTMVATETDYEPNESETRIE